MCVCVYGVDTNRSDITATRADKKKETRREREKEKKKEE